MEFPEDLKYTKDHEWVRVEGNTARVGITDYAQSKLTDIVYLELKDVGTRVEIGDEIGVVESVKSISEIYTPVTGKIIDVNKELEDFPERINQSPYESWLVLIEMENPSEIDELMNFDEYRRFVS